MGPVEELIHTSEYWLETIQNKIFRLAKAYMERNNLNQTQLAEHLQVSKGYVSQIMNGNFNLSLSKLIDLSLALEGAPVLEFQNIGEFAKAEVKRLEEMRREGMHQDFSFRFRKTVLADADSLMRVNRSVEDRAEKKSASLRVEPFNNKTDTQACVYPQLWAS